MATEMLRRVPWTCEWGQFGGAVEIPRELAHLDDVFWTCRHPMLSPQPRLLVRGECDRCPYWTPIGEVERRAPTR